MRVVAWLASDESLFWQTAVLTVFSWGWQRDKRAFWGLLQGYQPHSYGPTLNLGPPLNVITSGVRISTQESRVRDTHSVHCTLGLKRACLCFALVNLCSCLEEKISAHRSTNYTNMGRGNKVQPMLCLKKKRDYHRLVSKHYEHMVRF